MTQSAVANYESGRSRGTWAIRRKLEAIFRVPAADLLAYRPDKTKGDEATRPAAR